MSRIEVDQELRSYAALEEDWNSYDAPPIDPRAIAAGRALALAADDVPMYCSPANDGGVSLHWRGSRRLIRWLMVAPDGESARLLEFAEDGTFIGEKMVQL